MRRRAMWIALTFAILPAILASGAQAVVVNMSTAGRVGVALLPGTRASLANAGISTVSSAGPCSDPALSSDLVLPSTGLCSQGGSVMHGNETFAITWDPIRAYWQTTRNYVEQFLRDVADGRGTLSSPYAITSQYTDATGRAGNDSIYGGGCIDYGNPGGSTCVFPNAVGSGTGTNYPASGCPVTGVSYSAANQFCLTDSQLQAELATMAGQMGLGARTQPGHTPLLVLLTPPGVEICLDSAGTLCSANTAGGAAPPASFCSYHSQLDVGGTQFAYLVQPWTPHTGCDDPNVPVLPSDASAQQIAIDAGSRLASPLSQAQIAAIVNPWLNNWSGLDGSEINDNFGCGPIPKSDSAVVGSSVQNPYFLQPEFSNAGVIERELNAPACALGVALDPAFIVPSPIDQGDVVAFDGSTTVSSLIVPAAGYVWSFGDGATAVGPSVVHSYAKGGTYDVKLTVADRGGNVRSLSQTIQVLGPNGQPVSTGQATSTAGLHVRLQLLPQGLPGVLRNGVAMMVRSNEAANGIARLTISRAAARRAHIKAGRGSSSVVIGVGTVSGIKPGVVTLHMRLSRSVAGKLQRLGHLTLTVKLALVAAGGDRLAIDAAGRY